MDDKLYDAIARMILVEVTDEYGIIRPNPLANALRMWASDSANVEKMVKLVAKKVDMKILVEKVSENVISSFSGWKSDTTKETLNNMVIEKVADKLAEEKLKELI